MSDKPRQYSPNEINSIFARIDPQDVERFYQSYQLWTLQQQIAGLETQITGLHQQIAENNERMQQEHPSAIALATLARLQSHSVTDIDLLDRMLQRGETWLDQTMQRLAYCEQFDFIRNNYTEWCEHALDGAYDWIDSMQNASSSPEESTLTATSTNSAAHTNDALDEATEEILLQKLMSDEEAFMLEPTLKRPAVSPAQPQFSEPTSETSEERTSSDESIVSTQEEMIHAEFSDIPDSSHVPIVQALEVEQTEHIPAPEEVIPLETSDTPDTSRDTMEQVTASEQVEVEPVSAESQEPLLAGDEHTLPAIEEPMPSEANRLSSQTAKQESTQRSNEQHLRVSRPRRKRGFLRRLLTVFFHR